MPIYVYQCPRCHYRVELQRPVDHTPPFCGECPEDSDPLLVRLEKQPTAAAIQFRGSGWTPKGSGRNI